MGLFRFVDRFFKDVLNLEFVAPHPLLLFAFLLPATGKQTVRPII
jgi:hypothetical protein